MIFFFDLIMHSLLIRIEKEITESQLRSLFEIFKNKVFPQCESFKLEFI